MGKSTKARGKAAPTRGPRPASASKVARRAVEVQALSRKLKKKQENRAYSNNPVTVKRQAVSEEKEPTKKKIGGVRKDLYVHLERLTRDGNMVDICNYIAKAVKVRVTVSGYLRREKNSTSETIEGCESAKPVKLAVEAKKTNDDRQAMKFMSPINLDLNKNPDALEAVLEHNGTNLFVIKKSTLPGNSGLGVFSCQDFKPNSIVGYYCGKLTSGNI